MKHLREVLRINNHGRIINKQVRSELELRPLFRTVELKQLKSATKDARKTIGMLWLCE